MRILIFHGYLLSGTGSNVYNARLAEALVKLGHEVHLLSQDRHPERQSFVDAVGDWDGGQLEVSALSRSRAGKRPACTVYRPDIGRLLPVYVRDRYEGLEAKTFAQCTEAELAVYIQANVDAVREITERVRPQIALASHLVMGPVILARALAGGVPYAVKIHGSALEYTVKPKPERFLGFAREGLAQARTVLVGSKYTAESLWGALGGEAGLEHRTRLGSPGVDVERFAAREPWQTEASIRSLVERLRDSAQASPGEQASAFARDERATADALERLMDGEARRAHSTSAHTAGRAHAGPLVAFVGKLIVSKGVDLLIAAWPLVLGPMPNARLTIVGFGAYREGAERLIARLTDGDLEGAREIARAGRALETGEGDTRIASGEGDTRMATSEGDARIASGEGDTRMATSEGDARIATDSVPLRHLLAFLDSLSGAEARDYRVAARALREQIVLTGRLDHEELADVLPACDALVVPSTFPEAFGMVAAEAAACGVLPISAGHSGLAEMSEAIAREVPSQAAEWLSFPVDDRAVRAIAERVLGWLQADPPLKRQTRAGLVSVARERWSWEGVALGVIEAARGAPVTRPFG